MQIEMSRTATPTAHGLPVDTGLTLAGSAAFIVAAFLPVSMRVFPEPSPVERARLLAEAQGAWVVAQVLFAAGALVGAVGIAMLAARLARRAVLARAGVAAVGAGTLLWLWAVAQRAADPHAFAAGTLPFWPTYGYFLLTELGLAAVGLALLRTRSLPRWVGRTLVGGSAAFLVITLVFRDIPPFVFYLLTLALAIAAIRRKAGRGLASGALDRRGRLTSVPSCAHLDETPLTPVPADFEPVCSDCVAVGGYWVHLRRCLACDQVSCCDSSPAKHATAHARSTGHPVVTSAERGEHWRWCYVDQVGA